MAGSSGDYPSNIETAEPSLSWVSASERWKVTWNNGGADEHPPLISLASGETKTQVFRALATPEAGVDYFNEVNAIWQVYESDDECEYADLYTAEGGGTGQGGTGNSSRVTMAKLYDIQAVAADGTILSRILFTESTGIDILSWQEY